ncbi:MAG: cyclic nucleotide-binding domain-containing protein [Lachnospiraceae bacterium]|nr:cyclic nucleotide-binding domain-containing protein [Lachnospiraceae bacterium]
MSEGKINYTYLKDFFGIDDTPEGIDDIKKLSSRLIKVKYENGQDICTIDEDADGMYFLESGTAVVLDRNGEQINIMHEGQYFGEYGVLAKQKRLSTVRSLGRTVLYKLNAEDMMVFISKYPDIYGNMMKKVYGQVSGKHSQILALSGMRKGILRHPSNNVPMSKLQMLLQYGSLLLIYILSALFIPSDTSFPLFILPLVLMLGYVMITKRTIESLVVASILAAILVYRNGISAGYTDAIMSTMANLDNVFTVLVMALMGGMVNLIAASGAVTAFKKRADRSINSQKKAFFFSLGIMTATAIDDGLNMLCASTATGQASKTVKIEREKLGLFYSMLPTVLSSFFPLSLWGIFVIGTLKVSVKENAVTGFIQSVPFNFFSIITVLAMLLLCVNKLPKNNLLKNAEKRIKNGGNLWPEGSEKYLSTEEPEMWGKIFNIMIPIVVLAVSSLLIRSITNGNFMVDSACGLMAALLIMFILYCMQGLMSPEQFVENLITGIANSALPIILYLLTMCFSSLLEQLSLTGYFADVISTFEGIRPLLPCVFFLASVLLTIALGSSWAMYAIAFPIALNITYSLGLNPYLCIGAISSAGIAGEKICAFTSDALNVGTAIGCNPDTICRTRVFYGIAFTGIVSILYLIAGFII